MNPVDNIRYALGIDLGGTKIAVAIVSSEGELFSETEVPTGAEGGAVRVIVNLNAVAAEMTARAKAEGFQLDGIGLAAGGSIDVDKGRVAAATDVIPGWTGVDLKAAVGGSLPVFVDNDVNAAAFGEYLLGESEPPSSLALVAVGTGIGAGLVIDGRVLHGSHFLDADFGHVKVAPGGRKCLCGGSGCLEAYASGWAIAGRYREESGADDTGEINAGMVLCRAAEGDRVARTVVDEAIDHLCLSLANLITTVDPATLVLTGGVIEKNPGLLDRLRTGAEKHLRHGRVGRTSIRISRFGPWAGVVGSACLVFRGLDLV